MWRQKVLQVCFQTAFFHQHWRVLQKLCKTDSSYFSKHAYSTTPAMSETQVNEEKVLSNRSVISQLNNMLHQRIETAPNVESLLNCISLQSLSVLDAVAFLKKMTELFQKTKFDGEILEDERFSSVFSTLHEKMTTLQPAVLLQCLAALLEVSPHDIFIIESMERQVLWLLQKMSVSNVIRTLKLHHQHQQKTKLRKKVYEEAYLALEKRWVEINNSKDIVTLMYLLEKKDVNLLVKIEERALDLAEHIEPKQSYRILYLQAKRKRRNTPLLRALTYHLNKSSFDLSATHLGNLLYACGILNIYDTNLLEKISTSLISKLETLESASFVSSILTSISVLRWNHPELLSSLIETMQKLHEHMTPKELAGVILSFANLNFNSKQLKQLMPSILEQLEPCQTENRMLWLNVVWSLAILKLCKHEEAASVLKPEFYNFLKASGNDSFKLVVSHLKLMNIESAAKYEVSSYSGPFLPSDCLPNGIQSVVRSGRVLFASVLNALSKMAPLEKYVHTDVVTPHGFIIDMELCVNKDGVPVPYTEKHAHASNPAVHRLAVRVLDFADMTLHTVGPVGLHVMTARHLKYQGYTVVEIPYMEFNEQDTTVKKVQYLQRKFKDIVQGL